MAPAFRLCESHPGRLLTDHLEDVAVRLAPHGTQLRLAGLFHDIAKGTVFFQDYLGGRAIADQRLKNHAHLGALWLLQQLLPQIGDDRMALADAVSAFLLVAHHHTGLKNALDSLPPSDDIARWAMQIHGSDTDGAMSWLKSILKMPIRKPEPNARWAALRLQISKLFREPRPDEVAMRQFQEVIRSFGLLIEADRDSASGFEPRFFDSPARFTLSHVLRFRAAGIFGGPADPRLVEARSQVYQAALTGAEAKPFCSGHLWSMTVPTGAGKTIAALAWALQRREGRIAAGHSACPIIYALPFTSIIDQNARVLQGIWGDEPANESTLAIHHHVADPGALSISGEQSLAGNWTEGWRADVVCTTFLQVVNSLFHGTVADSRRFSHLAGSILILDEVQAVPARLWRLIKSALSSLAHQWATDVLLVTATQPAIFEGVELHELRPVFSTTAADAFDRYDLFVQTHRELELQELAECIRAVMNDADRPSCLGIVNTVREALDLLAMMEAGVDASIPRFHLSTNLRPKDRRSILGRVGACRGKPHLLIATQVVEAGVDLSFDVVFRAMAPLDALVQAAGRCNRHGIGRRGRVFLVRTAGDSGHAIYGNKEMGAAREILDEMCAAGRHIREPELQKGVMDYFRLVANRTGRDGFENIMEAIRFWEFGALRGEDKDHPEKQVQLIDDRFDSIPHYIETDDSDAQIWRAFRHALAKEDPRVRRTMLRNLRPELGQRIVEVPKKLALSDTAANGDLVYVPRNLATDVYDTNTGWRR